MLLFENPWCRQSECFGVLTLLGAASATLGLRFLIYKLSALLALPSRGTRIHHETAGTKHPAQGRPVVSTQGVLVPGSC